MAGSKMVWFPKQRWVVTLVALAIGGVAGCGSPVAEFRPNVGFQLKTEAEAEAQLTSGQQENIATILEGLFGTPDDPQIPEVPGVEMAQLLDETALKMAGGAVAVDEDGRTVGLYRQHCAHCHGITGDGMGPTAEFLNPYPRDYRMGIFKFKSTPKNSRPTREDLHRILHEGVPGTAMPSFRVLPEDQKESLVQYVIYLSMRGEMERLLVPEALGVGELGIEGDQLFLDMSKKATDNEVFVERSVYIQEQLATIGNRWLNAQSDEVPAPPENWGSEESLARGRQLFFGKGACSGCHGNFGLGDGNTTFDPEKPFLDDWTKENWPVLKGEEAARQAPIRAAAGILEKRALRPRNLRLGVYRGGRRPIDLYYRLRHGIEGTPMPGLEISTGDDPKKLTSGDVWSILDYIRNLPFESLSQPHEELRNLKRERL